MHNNQQGKQVGHFQSKNILVIDRAISCGAENSSSTSTEEGVRLGRNRLANKVIWVDNAPACQCNCEQSKLLE